MERFYFNEECSICNFEIKHYKKRSQLEYENCSQKGDKYLKALYVEFPDGTEIKGVDAFIYVWSNTKGYGWLSKLVSLPIIFTLAKISMLFLPLFFFGDSKFSIVPCLARISTYTNES